MLTTLLLGSVLLGGQLAPMHPKFNEKAKGVDAELSDFKWLIGNWQSAAGKTEYQESWLAPSKESMLGVFRVITDGKLSFGNLLCLKEENKKIYMLLREFSNDLSPIGSKTSVMVLISKSKTAAHFVNQFEVGQPTALDVALASGKLIVTVGADGSATSKPIVLEFKRIKP